MQIVYYYYHFVYFKGFRIIGDAILQRSYYSMQLKIQSLSVFIYRRSAYRVVFWRLLFRRLCIPVPMALISI
jgi:hypothetical protein